MTIPGYLEQAIFEGRAKAKVWSGGLNQQMVLKVPRDTYIVIYGYYFRPYMPNWGDNVNQTTSPVFDCRQAVQYVLFKTHNDFYPYSHPGCLDNRAVTNASYVAPTLSNVRVFTPYIEHQARATYMVSSKDVGIAFAYLNNTAIVNTPGTVTTNAETLPPNLQYGGETIDIFASGYYDPILGNFYYPLNEPYSAQSGLPGSNVSQYQVFTRPSGGTIPTPGTSTEALYNGKWPLITVMYAQFNEPLPENLK